METKKCPHCAETILVEAKKCKHCGESLNVAQKPKGQSIYFSNRSIKIALFIFIFAAFGMYLHNISELAVGSANSSWLALADILLFIPKWIFDVMQVISFAFIVLGMRVHFIEDRKSLTTLLFIEPILLALMIVFLMIDGESFESKMPVYLSVGYGCVGFYVGFNILRNYYNSVWLGLTMIVYFIAAAISTYFVYIEDNSVLLESGLFVSVILMGVAAIQYFSHAQPFAIPSDLDEDSELDEEKCQPNRTADMVVYLFAILMVFGYSGYIMMEGLDEPSQSRTISNREPVELYFVTDLAPGIGYYAAIASDDAEDADPSYSGWAGDMHIVTVESPDDEDLNIILQASDIDGQIYSIYPSTKHSDMIYFDGDIQDGDYYMDRLSAYGVVNIISGEYEMYEGSLLGIISGGRFDGSLLTFSDNTLTVISQFRPDDTPMIVASDHFEAGYLDDDQQQELLNIYSKF